MKKGVPFKEKKIELFNREFNYLQDIVIKVIREKSRGEGSLIEQDTIENVSEPNFCF